MDPHCHVIFSVGRSYTTIRIYSDLSLFGDFWIKNDNILMFISIPLVQMQTDIKQTELNHQQQLVFPEYVKTLINCIQKYWKCMPISSKRFHYSNFIIFTFTGLRCHQ